MDTAPAAPATRTTPRPDALSFRVIGAIYAVHRELGVGFLESVYEAALAQDLRDSGLAVDRQAALDVRFRGRVIGTFRADLIVERTILIELKVAKALSAVHHAQVINYLKVSGLRVGLLVNFARRAEVRRLVL